MAKIYTMTGNYDKAIDELEYLLSIESWTTSKSLRADPVFAPLRTIPRFKTVLKKFESEHTI
ncbi:MAG: hypothetical protein PVH24_02140 [Candidatus Zixiibacteriota bacterium]